MKDQELTGHWAGFSFVSDRLVSPEGNDFGAEDLRWLALTVSIKQEWCRMMDDEKTASLEERCSWQMRNVVLVRDRLRWRRARARARAVRG